MQTVNWEGCGRKQSWPILTLVMPGCAGGLCLKYFAVFAEITNISKKITPNLITEVWKNSLHSSRDCSFYIYVFVCVYVCKDILLSNFSQKIFFPIYTYNNINLLFETLLLILIFLNENLSVTYSTTLTSEQARKLFCSFL